MDPSLALRGMLLGFAIAAPVGPIGVLCIRRTLASGWRIGLVSGLGAATADATYGAMAAFGLTAVSALLVSGQLWLRLVGGLFLGYLGLRTLLAKPVSPAATIESAGPGEIAVAMRSDSGGSGLIAYASTLGLTLTNPTTILSFAAIFAGLGVGLGAAGNASRDYLSAGLLVLGVFAGSALWWLILSSTVAALRARFRPGIVGWVGRASGAVLLTFGLLAIASALQLALR
jgi:threonine/homoserine/homoserine lactone efflux protein